MDREFRILMLEDNEDDALLNERELRKAKLTFSLKRSATRKEFVRDVEEFAPDAIIADYSLPQFSAIEALRFLEEQGLNIPFILVTGTLPDEIAVECLKEGADDYILKSSLKRLPTALLNAIAKKEREDESALAEAALRRSEELYRLIAENTRDLTSIIDTANLIVYASPSFKTMLGYDPEELIGSDFFSIVHPDDNKSVKESFQEATPRRGRVVEFRFINRRDEWRVFESVGSWRRDDRGNPQRMIIVSRDITERRRSEEKIREQAALLDVAQDAIMVCDLKDKILFWNKGAENIYGWIAQEALGRNSGDILYKEIPAELEEAHRKLLEEGRWTGELHQVTKAGNEVEVESRWTPMRDGMGNPISKLIVNTDITAKKKLEAQLMRSQRMESIGALASGIAHDLNNVLTPILLISQILKDRLFDEQSRQMLTMLEEISTRGADLIKQVLSFGRGFESNRSIIQIKHLILEMEKIIEKTFPKSIEFYKDIQTDLWTIKGDPTQLHQILINLCLNARDAMPSGGRLSITASNFIVDENYALMNSESKVGPYLIIAVADTGIGIAPENLDKIFEPFFTTKEIDKGTGLGLSTVFTITKGFGGFVKVSSKAGKGTEFKIYLPAIEAVEDEPLRAEKTSLPAGRGETILVVDDEASIREIMKTSLEAFGYKTMTACDGIDAVTAYVQNKDTVDLMILDMNMPLMDGPAAIRAIQRLKPDIKVIIVSGLASSDKVAEARSLGVKAVLAKPYTIHELLKIIDDMLHS